MWPVTRVKTKDKTNEWRLSVIAFDSEFALHQRPGEGRLKWMPQPEPEVGELEWTRNPATSQSKYQRRIIRISLIIFVGGVEWILSLLPCSGWYVSHSSAPPAWPGNRGGTRLENRKKNIFSPVLFFPSCVWCWRAYMEKYTYHHYHPKLTSELFSERENTSVHFYSRNRGARITKSSHFRSHPTINMDFCIYSI